MHEMALMNEALRTIEELARREAFSRVKVLTLEIGALAAVDPEAIRFCFDSLRGGLCAGAELVILEPPGRAWCLDCAAEVGIARRGDPCPECGGFVLRVTGGGELKIKDLEVA